MSDEISQQVLLYAVNDTNEISSATIVHLLSLKKLKSYHIHVATSKLTQDEEFLSHIVIINALNKRLFLHQTDITSEASIQHVIESVKDIDGRIDVLVCHMGERSSSVAAKQTFSTIQKVYEDNFYPNVHFISQISALMKKCQQGQVVVVNSYAGRQGLPYTSVYSSSRYALEGFLESVAAEICAHKVSVTIIETVLECEEEKLMRTTCSNNPSDLDRDLIQQMETRLQKKNLMKDVKAEKLSKCIQNIILNNNPDLRHYLNKSCKRSAKAKYADHRGLQNLSEVTKFFLNVDLEDIRGRRVPYTIKTVDEKQSCVINYRRKITI